MCLKLYDLDPARFFSVKGMARQVVLNKTRVKLDLLTDIDMLLTLKKGITGEIYHAIHWYVKLYKKYMKDYKKNKNHHI